MGKGKAVFDITRVLESWSLDMIPGATGIYGVGHVAHYRNTSIPRLRCSTEGQSLAHQRCTCISA